MTVARILKWLAIHKLGVCIAISSVLFAGAVWGDRGTSETARGVNLHHCELPPFQATLSGDCTREAARYAAAIVDLEIAQELCDEAYAAWYECRHGIKPPLPAPPVPAPQPAPTIQPGSAPTLAPALVK